VPKYIVKCKCGAITAIPDCEGVLTCVVCDEEIDRKNKQSMPVFKKPQPEFDLLSLG
jgi:hypothetical protein